MVLTYHFTEAVTVYRKYDPKNSENHNVLNVGETVIVEVDKTDPMAHQCPMRAYRDHEPADPDEPFAGLFPKYYIKKRLTVRNTPQQLLLPMFQYVATRKPLLVEVPKSANKPNELTGQLAAIYCERARIESLLNHFGAAKIIMGKCMIEETLVSLCLRDQVQNAIGDLVYDEEFTHNTPHRTLADSAMVIKDRLEFMSDYTNIGLARIRKPANSVTPNAAVKEAKMRHYLRGAQLVGYNFLIAQDLDCNVQSNVWKVFEIEDFLLDTPEKILNFQTVLERDGMYWYIVRDLPMHGGNGEFYGPPNEGDQP